MFKSGKYDLFFFSTEDNLILYHSKNKIKKIVGFCILKTNRIEKILPFLNENLKKGILMYYSIQFVNVPTFSSYIFLNFQDKTKENILKPLNMLTNELKTFSIKESIEIEFLSKNELNEVFTGIISKELNKDMKIQFENNLNFLKNKEIIYYFKFFSLAFIDQEPPQSILNIIFNLINDLGINGKIILNFQLKKGIIAVNIYLIEYYQKVHQLSNFITKADDFINNKFIIKEIPLSNRLIGKWLWRLNISNKFISYNINEKIIHSACNLVHNDNKLNKDSQERKEKLLPVNIIDFVEDYLKENELNFKQINSNLCEINGQYLILFINDYNPALIHKTLVKYYPNRTIFLIFGNSVLLNKLLSKTKIQKLSGVRVFSSNSFIKLLNRQKLFV